MPIYTWWQLHDTGDMSWLLKKGKSNWWKNIALKIIWIELYDEYIGVFGFGESMNEILIKEKELIRLYTNYIVKKDKGAGTFIIIAEKSLVEMKSKITNGEKNFYLTKARIEKLLGFTINPKECSVKEFYSYIKMIEKDNG